ncbi:MAG: LuxR C-terminal-related transcriptional regulator [Clostridia bacterium]|nr:LuxR C-terminal-related transcriptional regulator [Clostridia bacterium]
MDACRLRAARWYEQNDLLLQALEQYETMQDRESIRGLLIRNAMKHPGAGCYFELRKYYLALPEEEVSASPVLMAALCMLCSILTDTKKSEMWYARLKEYTRQTHGVDRREAMTLLYTLDITLPHRGTGNMVELLKNMSAHLLQTGTVLPPLSLTNNCPSLMNGGKDFCPWSKQDEFLAATIGGMLERMMGTSGIGLVQAALGESRYEKGCDSYNVLTCLTRSRNQCEHKGTPEMMFVSIGLQARLAAYTGEMEEARAALHGMEKQALQDNCPRLLPGIHALRCRLMLMQNDLQHIGEWMASAPDEHDSFCIMDRYLYMTKIRCYLALGQTLPAIALLERMQSYAVQYDRSYIAMECGLLMAIARKRSGQPWQEDLQNTLAQLADFSFVRMIAEEGAAILPLLTAVYAGFCAAYPQYHDWLDNVLKETEGVARRYPNYLIGSGVDVSDFTETALAVLRLQAVGYTTKEIADRLHIAQSTVKYHSRENYRKLGARDLVDAVQIAQSMHLL